MDWAGFCCFHCRRRLAIASHGICSRCYKLIKQNAYCGGCGSPLLEYRLHCGNCLRYEPKWHRLVQISHYKSPLAEWIHHFKFQQGYWWDQALARLMLLAIRNAQREHFLSLPEVILPVPLFWQRQWTRGYNQSELLAKCLSKWLNIPLDRQCLQRVRPTVSQRELTAVQRRQNLRQAFAYQPFREYRRVAVVDDVLTTGSTLNAISALLLKQGVKEIQVWVLART